MIIKTISHKRMPFSMMLEYIREDQGNRDNTKDLEVFSNLSSLDPREISREFQDLYDQRTVRKDGVKFHHVVMSFHPNSTPHLTEDKLSDLAYKFLELRAFNGLAYGALHKSEGHQHLHFMISNARVDDPKKAIRLDNEAFRKIQTDMELYQAEKYPELSESIVYNKLKEKDKYRKPEDRETTKRSLIDIIDQVFNRADSRDLKSFCENADSTPGLTVYHYRDKAAGIEYSGRKWRWSTLGFGTQIKTLEKLDRLRKLRESKDLDREDYHPEQE